MECSGIPERLLCRVINLMGAGEKIVTKSCAKIKETNPRELSSRFAALSFFRAVLTGVVMVS
jgi:hypothetical protein